MSNFVEGLSKLATGHEEALAGVDWPATPLGPVSGWPAELVAAVAWVGERRTPLCIWWGPQLVMIANEAAKSLLGAGLASGQEAGAVWRAHWPSFDDDVARARQRIPIVTEGVPLPGDPTDENAVRLTHVLTVLDDGHGGVGGLLQTCLEETSRARNDDGPRLILESITSHSTSDVIFVKDREGRMLFANPAALALIGKTADRVIGRTDADFLEDPEAARAVMENDRRVMESGVPVDVDELVPLADGTERIWHSRKTPHRDARGRVVGLLGVSRDVTDQRRAWQRLRGLYDAVASLSEVASVEELGRVTLQQGLVALGASAGSLALLAEGGDTLEMVGMVGYPSDSIERWRTFPLAAAVPLAETVRRGAPIYIDSSEQRLRAYPELETLRAEVGTRSSACLPLVIGGRTVGALGLSFESEAAFSREDRDFMLSLSRQCSQALDRIRLFEGERRAREEAERASLMKDEFLATLSHELRTPLNAILGWATLLIDQASANAALTKGLVTIQRNARAQTKIIEDLLDMSRIINGNVRLDLQPCDLVQVLKEAVESIRPTAEAKGIRLHAVLTAAPATMTGDPARLQQVFWNLLTNAVKFTSRGGEVRVSLARANSHLEITVADTGDGIDAAFLPYVFDRFRQADGGITRRHGGLGLGLAIAKQLVELHGGSIDVKSPGVGRGATFTAELPFELVRRDSEIDGLERSITDAPPSQAEPPKDRAQLMGLRILVVDDEPDALALLEELLCARGAVVRCAASSPQAMECIALEAPDVIVSDIGLPGEDGYELLRRIRERHPELPSVALTAYASPDDRLRAMRAGFQAHLTKPLDAAKLVAILAGFARGRSVEAALDGL